MQNIKRVSCLAHVIQFASKELLDKIRISSKNDDFQKNWNDKHDKEIMKKEEKDVLYTLTKISIIFCIFWNQCN